MQALLARERAPVGYWARHVPWLQRKHGGWRGAAVVA